MDRHNTEGGEADKPTVDQRVVESIEALSNTQRLEILVALADRKYTDEEETAAMTFTELYDAVDCQSTSQFSYHLSQLVDTFIVETPDGYQLTYAGDKVQRAIVSGLYESPHPFEPVAIDGTCPSCEAQALEARTDNDRFVIDCAACDSPIITDLFPRSVSQGRSPREIVESFGYSIWAKYLFVRGDVCPECYGVVETAIELTEKGRRSFAVAVSECQECRFTVHIPVDVIVAFHPVVMDAFWQHGVSLLDIPLWEVFEYTTDDCWNLTVESTDPFAATVEITLDDATLRLTVDDSAAVTLRSR